MSSAIVDLAHEPDFQLGGLLVRPSACAARSAGRERRIEPRVMEVLVLLARAANHTVTRDDLIEACWGGRFVSEDAISRVIGKVRNLARSVDPAPFVLETVPKVGFRLITTERDAVRRAPREPPAAGQAGGRIWASRRAGMLALIALLALMGGWGLWRFASIGRASSPPTLDQWVEVAGFTPLQDDPALKRLTLLANDAMGRALAANGVDPVPLPAASRSSARLRMAGAVDRDGDQYVISARLEERRSGAVLWSRRMARPVGDSAGLQETIAGHVSDVLQCGQFRAQTYGGRMPDRLLALFLHACSAGREDSERAQFLEVTRRLVNAAPRLSTAHSMHAAAAGLVARQTEQGSEAESLRNEARSAALRAIELDPNNGEAFAALAAPYAGGRWREREAYIRRALQLGWTPANNSYIWILLEVGRVRDATDLAVRTAATDPFSTNALERSAWLSAVSGDLAGSKQALERLELNDPAAGVEARLRIELWHDEPRLAAAEFERAEGRWPAEDIRCARQYLLGGWLDAGAQRQGLPADCANQQASARVRMLARSGQVDAAYQIVDAEFPALQDSTIFLFYPEMKRFRQDPRFMPLARRFGLAEYWLQTNRWPDFCEEPDLPYDCRSAAQAALDRRG